MNRNKLKTYAPQARRDFIEAVTARAAIFGLTAKKIEPMTEQGDVVLIVGRAFPKAVGQKRKKLEVRIQRQGFDQTMEAMAYTWFNRLVAIRFMELHGYLDHGYRVLSSAPSGSGQGTNGAPEIVQHAEHVDLPGLDKRKVIELKLDGTKEEELYRLLLVAQCNALNKAMPFLFESIDDETELLVPDHLLHSDSLIRRLVEDIPEEDWQEVEIIGWLYQFYISEKKDEVIGKVVKSEDIPAATQLFTPNWIVKYLVQNSLGRQWMATYPNSPLRAKMEYYIEPAEQTPEVQAKLAEITPKSLNPEELTLLDPACGSGHILVEAYDLLKAIYQERGYRAKDIPRLILEKNLFGLEIDDRAAQLAAFALMMKARADDRTILSPRPLAGEGSGVRAIVQPHVLAIQESKGLDAREITEALNQPILKEEPLPSGELFEEIADENTPLFSRKNLVVKGAVSLTDVTQLIELFEHGKTFGSLIQVLKSLAEQLPAIAQRVEDVIAHGGMFEKALAMSLLPLLEQAQTLSSQYDVVVTNPPYMGSKYYSKTLKSLIHTHGYKTAKNDLYACFMHRNSQLCKPLGFVAMITRQGWMFASGLEDIRKQTLERQTIQTLIHLGRDAFPSIKGDVVKTVAFVLSVSPIDEYRAVYHDLQEGDSAHKQGMLLSHKNKYSQLGQSAFMALPGEQIAYWLSEAMSRTFRAGTALGNDRAIRAGITTGDNPAFVREWYEVAWSSIGFGYPTSDDAWQAEDKQWFPVKKGGAFRKWYGNNGSVIRYDVATYRILKGQGNHCASESHYFHESLSWSDISAGTFGIRYYEQGMIFTTVGHSVFSELSDLRLVAGLLNTPITVAYLRFLNPDLHANPGEISLIPYIPLPADSQRTISANVEAAIGAAKADWNSCETSWGFDSLASLMQSGSNTVSQSQEAVNAACLARVADMRRIEEENNQLVIEAYGLQDELSPEVPDNEITLYRPDRVEDIRRLVSYAIGCMMGRYSLDEPGLIYAHGGNQGFDPAKYRKFPADEDGIIPVTDFDWFADDATSRFEKFIATAWPAEHLEENLTFVAESLGPKNGESPRATIRRYLAVEFFKHHMSMYKKRPIYWLFTSGKQRGFQALVYLHRYNEGTLARMRTEYVIPLLGKMTARIKQLSDDIDAATATARKKRLEKEQATLTKQLAEVQAFDEKLRHYADQRIALDLDDGVKVNYGKFGDLLAEVKSITGRKDDE